MSFNFYYSITTTTALKHVAGHLNSVYDKTSKTFYSVSDLYPVEFLPIPIAQYSPTYFPGDNLVIT